MAKISAVIAAALLTATGFASAAEAHGPNFYASPFFRNQGRPAPDHCASGGHGDYGYALERARERRFAEMRAQRAAGAAAQAAAAKRARLVGLRRREAAKIAAARTARQVQQTANAADTTTAAKKGNLLPTGVPTAPTGKDKSSAKATAAVAETFGSASETKVSTADTCRKYSAAADGLIDIPCE